VTGDERSRAEILQVGGPQRAQHALTRVTDRVRRTGRRLSLQLVRRAYRGPGRHRPAGARRPARRRHGPSGAIRARGSPSPSRVGLLLLVLAAPAAGLWWTLAPAPPEPAAPSGAASSTPRHAPSLIRIAEQARLPIPLHDYVRPDRAGGNCPVAPLGYSAADAVDRALDRILPHYVVQDSARTFNQSTGMCSLTVRGTDRVGTVVVVQVIAPSHPALSGQVIWLSDAAMTEGGVATTFASATTSTGWTVNVGTIGPSQDRPPIEQLFALAQAPELLW
jgi:hypothetical protein